MVGQKFDPSLTLNASGDWFYATGPIPWDACYYMSVFIVQSEGAGDVAAASGLGQPEILQGTTTWRLKVQEEITSTRHLKGGEAYAMALSFFRGQDVDRVEQWAEIITLV